jgi:DNA topoisomerase VI subunit B
VVEETKTVVNEFQQAVNMTARELESWLNTKESRSVGQIKEGHEEAIGHESGRHIVEILHKKQSDYSQDDLSQMKRVISYVRRHSAQKPSGEIEHTRWRYSLMNWGHDPLKVR